MTDRSDLIRQANELRQQAELEADENIRARLTRMAAHYAQLAQNQSWSGTDPATSLEEVFRKGD